MSVDPEVKRRLDLRLAAGEIDVGEYNRLMGVVSGGTRVTPQPHPAPSAEPVSHFSDSSPTEIDRHTAVGGTLLVHRGRTIPFTEIRHVETSQFTDTFIVMVLPVNTQGASLSVVLRNGNTIKARAASMYFKTNRMKLVARAAEHVRVSTFHSRYEMYLGELERTGHISCGNTHIKLDGNVEQGRKRIDMRLAYRSGTFTLGVAWESMNARNRKYDPHKIGVSEKKDASHWTQKKIVFRPKWDIDAIWAIMQAIAKGEISG